MKLQYGLFMIFLILGIAAESQRVASGSDDQPINEDKYISAEARLISRNGSKVKGTIRFVQVEDNIQVQYNVKGLGKMKNYGFHIHEVGDCSSPDAMSAGSHYILMALTGGTSLESPGRYAGDLPQLSSDSYGRATGYDSVSNLSINEKNAILGRSVVIKDGPDDPNKPAPKRIACGVIR